MPTDVNIALFGSKFMGRAHSHAWGSVNRFFPRNREPTLHTVAARNQADVERFAQQWGWRHARTRWQDAVDDPAIDLIDIVTPNHIHAEQAIAALEAGKHVACEKPLAATIDEAEAMAAAASTAAGHTFVWYNYRRVPAVALAHQLVSAGKLGRIYHVRAAYLQSWGGPQTPLLWRFQQDMAGSGAHGDLNAHSIDAVRFITGEEITTIEGAIEQTFIPERAVLNTDTAGSIDGSDAGGETTAASTVDDAVLFIGRLSGGGVASFEASRVATGYHNANRREIHGEKGALRFNFERMNELDVYGLDGEPSSHGWTTIDVTRSAHAHPYADAWWPDSHGLGYDATFTNQAADILAVLDGEQPVVPLPDFTDALRTQRVLHAALECARHRTPITVSTTEPNPDS